jgi:hypothetical protein
MRELERVPFSEAGPIGKLKRIWLYFFLVTMVLVGILFPSAGIIAFASGDLAGIGLVVIGLIILWFFIVYPTIR